MSAPIVCPNCSSFVPDQARFCPVCRAPRTEVEAQLRQAAMSSGQDYNDLLKRAQDQDAQQPHVYQSSTMPAQPPVDTAKKRSRKRGCLIGAGAIALLMCVVIAVISATVDSDTPERRTNTPSTSAAAPTSRSSAELMQPTPVARTSDHAAYARDIQSFSNIMTGSMNAFSSLVRNPRFGDDAWTMQLATELVTWDVQYQRLRDMSPPSDFRDAHNKMLDGMRELTSASDDITAGIDNQDVTRINQATATIDRANALFIEAADLMPD